MPQRPEHFPVTAEQVRLDEARARTAHWRRWGPYLSERAWGTVREDYSADGNAWGYFPHDHARARAYRWSEDGLAGICDRHQYVCFALALWNTQDVMLKERLFGLSGPEGNHGEDVKEQYFYTHNTPTHSYMEYVYLYPHAPFPYGDLVDENRRRGRGEPEYELLDTGVFAEQRYFEVTVRYAKRTPESVLIEISVTNQGPERAPLDLLPTIWFRNTWSWAEGNERPHLAAMTGTRATIELDEPHYGKRWLLAEGAPELLFTENETNHERLFGRAGSTPYTKDAFHHYVVNDKRDAVNPRRSGTKAAVRYRLEVEPGATKVVRLLLTDEAPRLAAADGGDPFGAEFASTFETRRREADEFYRALIPRHLSADAQRVARQAFAGLLWSKQYYHFVVRDWLRGDPSQPPPPRQRKVGRNHEWTHVYNADVISMPDKWEYPWYAAWDLAFHCVPLALIDVEFAKEQLVLFLREWYMHPNGQIPAYEWAFGDVNPPVHAWAAWRVYKIEKRRTGHGDVPFLERVFQKLLLNFTWWVNRKDAHGRNVFQGGFLGLDNIGVFDRSAPLPTGGHLEQSDGTSWMAMYCLNMLAIALELAHENPVYEDVASKFWEHFLYIARAMNESAERGLTLWDEEDGFFYDVLHHPSTDQSLRLKVRSLVGLIPLFAVETLEPEVLTRLPDFARRLQWFVEHRQDLTQNVASMTLPGRGERRLLSVVPLDKLRRILQVMLDENEFLSPYGIRSLSRVHAHAPYVLNVAGEEYRVDYQPAESNTQLFGGNSNWRGPIWMPVNYLLIESLQKFHHYLGDDFTVEYPTGSGKMRDLGSVATDLSRRLAGLLLQDEGGERPATAGVSQFRRGGLWENLIPFHEYFDGDTGAGLGACHQTGWTALVAKLILQSGEHGADAAAASTREHPESLTH
ncbi:MAG: glucosidase [Planctomycetota bacterium]